MMDKMLVNRLAPRILKFKIDDMDVMTTALRLIDITDNRAVSNGRFPKEEILDYHIYHACRICEYPLPLSEINWLRRKEKKQPLNLTVIELLKNTISKVEDLVIKDFPFRKYVRIMLDKFDATEATREEFAMYLSDNYNVLKYRSENITFGVCLYHACNVSGQKITLIHIMRTLHVSRDGIRKLYKELLK